MKTNGRWVWLGLGVLLAALMALAGNARAQEKPAAGPGAAAGARRCVVVWSEGTADKKIYPKDINGAIAEGLAPLAGWEVVTASINDPDQGLPDALLQRADVLIWWGHKRHDEVKDALVAKIADRVKNGGMGFIALHSSHFAKPNKALMGTPCTWGAYVADSTTLTLKVKDPAHPIAKGVKDFTIPHSERYSEPYAVPEPQAVVFEGVHAKKDGGLDPSRVGMCWQIGRGKFFYFQAGHEADPVYYDPNVRQILRNAVLWAAPERK